MAANAVAHKPVEVVQHDAAGQTFHDSLNYNSVTETAGIFDGISAQPVHSQTIISETKTAAHSGDQNQSAPVQNSDAATQAKSEVKTTEVSVATSPQISVRSTISAAPATAVSNPMTQQLTASLTTANGPPANAAVSQSPVNSTVSSNSSSSPSSNGGSLPSPVPHDSGSSTIDLLQSISDDLHAIGSGSTPSPIDLGDATLAGILSAHGIQLSFSDLTISGGAVTAGTVTITATSADMNLGPVTSDIGAITGTYDIASKTFSLTLNSVNMNFSSFVNIHADSVNLTYDSTSDTTVNVTDGTNTTTASVSVLTLGVNNATIFAGLNGPSSNSDAVGVEVTGANLALALMSTSDGKIYYGVHATATSVAPVGLPDGFTLTSTDIQIDVNGSTDGNNVVNFDSSFTPGTGLTVATGGDPVNLDYTGQIIQASGTIDLSFNGFVYIHGNMAIQSQSSTTVTLTDGTDTTTKTVSELTIGADDVTIFAGMNGPSTESGAVGVELDDAGFALALFTGTDGKIYYGLQTTVGTLKPVGLPDGFEMSATDLQVQVNSSNDGNNVVDFDSSFTPGTGLTVQTGPSSSVDLDYTNQFFQASGTLELNFNGFVYISGSFAILSQPSTSVTLTDGSTTTTKTVSELTIGADGVTIFAGVNGPSTNDGAVGVELDDAGFALALFTGTDGKVYYGLQTTVGTLEPVGLPDGFEMHATDLQVQVNGSNDGDNVVDFKASFGDDGLAVQTGPTTSVNLDYTNKFFQASGTIELDFDGFVYIKGSFAILSQPSTTVTLTDGTDTTTKTVSELTIGADGVTIFAGMNGPSTNPDAVGVELDDAGFALALFTGTDGKVYYGLQTTVGTLKPVGLPDGFDMSATDLQVQVNSSNDGNNVVDFDAFNPGTGLTVQTGPSSSVDLDYTNQFFQASGTIELDFGGFVYIHGSFAILSQPNASVTVTDGTDTATKSVSELTIGASDVTIFAGINGPSTNPDAVGVELDNANLALALFTGTDGKVYYGVVANATSLAGVGLPGDITVGAGDLDVQVNGSNDGNNVVDFQASFGDDGLAVQTGPSTSVNLDFTESYLRVAGSLDLGVGDFIHVSGGFSFTQTPDEIDINVGHTAFDGAEDLSFIVGSESSPVFSASGFLSMTITSTALTISEASMTIDSLHIGSILEADSLTVAISNLSIDLATGDVSGVTDDTGVHDPILTITVGSATLFPDGGAITGGVSPTEGGDGLGFQGTFDLSTGAFDITVEQFHLAIGSTFTADASDVHISYDPSDSDPHQQLVQIGDATLDFKVGSGDITGNVNNLTIYKDGFHFDSVTLGYTGTINLGSVLTITNPSVTLTDFGMIFGGSVDANGSLTVSAASASLNLPSISASVTNLSVTIALDPDHLGDLTASAGTISFSFSTYVSMQATNVNINTNPDDGEAYLSVTSATISVALGSGPSLTGTATNFSIINSGGSAAFYEGIPGDDGAVFSVTITATPGQLKLPTWLGFQIQKLEIHWDDFATNPGDFTLILSASINSISGLPGGVTVSGEITDAVIDIGKLESGDFPITAIGSFGGSISGTLFGMEVNAGFILGIVNFNAEGNIVNPDGSVTQVITGSDGTVTEITVSTDGITQVVTHPNGTTTTTHPTSGPTLDTDITGTTMYVGVAGGAEIPGVGGVQIYIGFSSLGPLTFYISAEFPLILDPDTGIAIGGFSGGVLFDYSLPTPNRPQDLAGITISEGSVTLSQWQQQLRQQTITQFTASGGGTDLTAAYSQPFVIEAGVTLYDAYATENAFSVTGNIAVQIDPQSPNSVRIYMDGLATFGDSISFNAYLYLDITVSGNTSSATVMFLVQEPANTPVEQFGGSLKFGFTDSDGNPITPTVSATIYSEWIALGTTYDDAGNASIHDLPAGTYVWTPGANDISLTVGDTTYLAVDAVNGIITFTTASTGDVALVGTANAAISGTLGSVLAFGDSLPAGAQYAITTFSSPAPADGFYISLTGFLEYEVPGDSSINVSINGAITLTVTSTEAKLDLWGDLNISLLGDVAVAQGEFVIDYTNPDSPTFYGALMVATGSGLAKLEQYGLTLSGALLFQINTTGEDQIVNLPNAPPATEPPNTGTVAPLDGTPFTIQGSVIFDISILGVDPDTNPYATISYEVDGNTMFQMQGFFDLRLTDDNGTLGLQMFADIHELTLGPSDSPFLSFSGFGLFIINSQGLAAEISLNLNAGNDISGISFDANFNLIINTTSQAVNFDVPSVTVPTSSSDSTATVGIPIYTYDTDGTATLAGTVTSLIIPAGPPLSSPTIQTINSTPTGTFTPTGAAGPYVVIMGGGSLTLEDTLTMHGYFYFQVSDNPATGFSLTLALNVTGDISGIGTATVTGGLQISSAGTVALLSVSGQGGNTTDYGSGISFQISAELALNTTDNDVDSIGGIDVPTITAHSWAIVASGTVTFAVGDASLVINGVFSLTTTNSDPGKSDDITTTTIKIGGTLTATVGSDTLLTMDVNGVLVASYTTNDNSDSATVYGALVLTASGGNPLSGNGFSFNGSFLLEVNTTGAEQNPNGVDDNPLMFDGSAVVLSAGPGGSSTAGNYFQIYAVGTMVFGTTTTGFVLVADPNVDASTEGLFISISNSGLAISASVKMSIVSNGSTLLTVSASGAMLISSDGFALGIQVTANFDDPNSPQYYAIDGTFTLEVNTTGSEVTIGSVDIPAAPNGSSSSTGGAYFQMHIDGTMVLGSTDTDITSASYTGLYMHGDFYLTISSAGLAVSATASMHLKVSGTDIFTFDATGALLITSSGVAAKITLTISAGGSGTGFGFDAGVNFLFELNTTGSPVNTINNVAVNLPGGPYFKIVASGKLVIGGVVNISGSFTLTVDSSSVEVTVNATLNLFGNVFSVSGAAGFYSDGFALSINLSLGGSSSPVVTIVPGVLTLSGSFLLQINTTGNSHFGVNSGTTFNVAVNASFNVFGFSMASLAFNISESGGVFSATGTVNFDFFGFITLHVDFYFDSHGNYWFYSHNTVQVGPDGFNIHGSLTLEFASNSEIGAYDSFSNVTISHNFELDVNGGVTAFGISDIISADVNVTITGTSVDMSVWAGITIPMPWPIPDINIGGTVHIHLGTLNTPTPPPPPPLGSVSTGTITVNGQDFGSGTLLLYLGSYADSDRTGVPSEPDENYFITQDANGIHVTAPGVTGQTETYTGVTEIVVPNAGSSNTIIQIDPSVTIPVVIFAGTGINQFYMGSGTGTVNGTSGTDTVFGGSGSVTFNTGTGTNTFQGGAANNTINDPPGNVNLVESGYSYYSLDGTSATSGSLTYGDGTTNYTTTWTDENAAVTLTGVASGTQTFSIQNFTGSATIDSAGNSSATTSVEVDSGNLTVDGNTVTESGGVTGTITLVSGGNPTYGALELDGGSSANAFTVNSWAGGALTLDGKGGNDTYNINFQNSGSFTATVSDSGSADNDSLVVNGTTGADTIHLSGSAVSLGSQTVNYSGVEGLTLYTKTGGDTVDITGISVATTINTGSGTNTINIGTNAFVSNMSGNLNSVNATLTINGGGTETLNLDDTGDSSANTGTLTSSALTGIFGGSGSLNYSNVETFYLNLGSGGNTFTIQSSSTGSTNINSGTGNDTVNVRAMSGTMNISTGTGTNTVNIGSTMPTTGGVLKNIKGALTITGAGTTTLNADDTGDGAATGTLTGTTLTGFGMGVSGITYSGIATLNISLGNGGNTFTITNTNASTNTTLNSGNGSDTIYITTDSGTTTVNAQDGADTVNITTDGGTTTINGGNGNDTVNVAADSATTYINGDANDDIINIQTTGATTNINTGSGANTINIGSLAPTITGGNISGIQGAINITGSDNDTLNVDDTGYVSGRNSASAGYLTSTALTGLGMAGGITYSGIVALNISFGSGNDTLNVQSTYSGAITTVNTGAGTNVVNVTDSSVLAGIAGELIVNGQGTDTMTLDDTADAGGGTLTQTTTVLTGLGMGANGIHYSSIETLNINLGAHNDTVYIQGNPSVTTENLNTGAGSNIISIGSAALSSITTDPTTGDSTNTGSVLDNVQGIINITGSGTDTLNIDDSGATTGEGGGLWSNKIQFLDPVTINFSGVSGIYIALSEANDQFIVVDTITSASTSPVVVIDGNEGGDTLLVLDTHAVMTMNGGDGDDNFYNFGNSSVLNLNGDAGDDTFYIYASVSENTSNVDPGAADSNGNQVYSYRVNAVVNIDGGSGNDKVFIYATILNDVLIINGTNVSGAGLDVNYTNIEQLVVAGLGGDDTFYIESITVPTTIIGDGTIVLPDVADFLNALNVQLPDLTGGAPAPTSFNDTFYVGWQGASYIPGTLSGIVAPLTIYGDDGPNLDSTTTNTPDTIDTVYVDDTADTANRNFTLTATDLTGGGFGDGGSLIYDSAVENLNFHVGNGNNTITINGNDTASQTSIYGGNGNDTFIVNDDPLQAPLALFGGLNTFVGDTLIVNGDVDGNTFDITGFTIDGAGATISYEQMEKLIINAGGATTFNVNGDSIPTYLNGGDDNDSFIMSSSVVPLYLDGGNGCDTFTINGNSGALTATGDAGNDIFTVNGNGGSITLSGGDDNDSFTINGNSGVSLTLNGDNGCDSFTVNAISSPTTLNGGADNDCFTVNTPLAAVLNVNGGGDSGDSLTVNGTLGNDYFTITSTSVNGVGSAINYSAINYLTVNAGLGDDTFLVLSDSVNTTLNGDAGNDLFYIRSTNGTTCINTGSGINTVDIGSDVPYPDSSILDDIQGTVNVNGNGNDTLNIDDTLSTTDKTGTLTDSTLNGLGMGAGGITYCGILSLNLLLGSGSDTLNIQSTNAATNTVVNTGAGSNTVNIGSLMPTTGGIIDGIQGPLTIVGSGDDTMNVDDTGSAGGKTGTLTPTTLTGLGMGVTGIIFSGLSALNISLGSGGNTFTIINTGASTVVTLNSGSGNDTVNLFANSDATNINSQDGDDTINIQSTGATTNINTGSGTNTINVGSNAPSGDGIIDNIQGAISITGSGSDTLNVDDDSNSTGKTGTLTDNSLTGLSMAGITYCGLAVLNVSLGSGNDTLHIQSTNDSTVTTVNTGAGTNTINIGSLMPTTGGIVDGIQGKLIVVGSCNDTMNVDDTGSTGSKTGTLTYNSLTGLDMGADGIIYSGILILNISLGSGGNTFTITNTNFCTVTTLNSGSGNDTVNLLSDSNCTYINSQDGDDTINIQSTGATTNINTGSGTNTINVGSLMPVIDGIVDDIQGMLNISGSGNDTLNVDDTGSSFDKTGYLTSNTLTGLCMGDCGIYYTGMAALNISLGSGDDTMNVQSTYCNTVTTINTGAGTNTINIGSFSPDTGGILDCIQGSLIIVGSGNDTMNVDDTGSTADKTGTLTPTTLTGLCMGDGGITYSGLTALNISLGSGDDTFNINDITNSTVTTVDGSGGANFAALYFSGDFSAENLTLLNFQTATLNVVGNFSGLLNDSCGDMTDITIGGSFTYCGILNVGSIDTMTVGCNFSGTLNVCGEVTSLAIGSSFTYCGVLNADSIGTMTVGCNFSGTLNITDAITSITIDGAFNYCGTLNAASIETISIGCDFAGTINVGGAITTFTIGGTFTVCGVVNAGSIDTMTITGNFAGSLNVTGLLNQLTVDGGTPGVIVVGDVNVITVLAGYGNVVLNVTEGGIQREILATPVGGGTLPNTIHFAFVYDSQTTSNPQLAIRITDTNPIARSFNLALKVVNSSTAKFNLSRIDSNGATGISNISVWGDILTQLTAPQLLLFTDLTASSHAGVVLPTDNITGVEVSGVLPTGFINVAGLEGLAFGIVTTPAGRLVSVSNPIGSGTSLRNLLGSDAVLNSATDAFVVPFNDTHSVTLFVKDTTASNLQKIITFTDAINDNLPIVAYVQVLPTTSSTIKPLVQCITVNGDGASINSMLSVANIFSNGSLGDIIITGAAGATMDGIAGLGNVTATSIFGNINVKNAGIYGIIQTTCGDIGQLLTNAKGKITVTTIYAKGDITGQIISRGDIISSITTKGSFSGVIAAQGNIGTIRYDSNGNAIVTSKGLTRFGGISIGKNDSGQIIALGNIFGDLTVKGTMTGRIVAEGTPISGLPETENGILGKVNIHVFATGSAILSGGQIGDTTGKVVVKLGKAAGFVAAAGYVNTKSKIAPANLLQNQTDSNLAALYAIFTEENTSLLFDTGGSLNGLTLIETDLANIQDDSGVLSGVIP